MTDVAAALPAKERAKLMRAQRLVRARKYTEDFVEYALRDQRTDKRLVNEPFHVEWQRFLRANEMAVLVAPVEHAKTQQIAVAKALHLIGQDPSRRGAIISNTAKMARKSLNGIRTHIEENTRVHEVFPDLKPSQREGDPWGQQQITVQRGTIANDPTLQAVGAFGDIVGSRLDFIIVDDILDFENTRTEEQRKKLIEWFYTTVDTRLTDGGVVYVIGTPWHPEDLLHELVKNPGWEGKWYSAVKNPQANPDEWEPLWPRVWPTRRLLKKHQNTPETVFSRKYLCQVRLEAIARFKEEWWKRAVALGRGRTFLAEAPFAQGNVRRLKCFTGVDLGVGQGKDNALTVIMTIALLDNQRRLIVDIQSGKWQSPEIIQRIENVYLRYDSDIYVENNGAQKFLVDFTTFPVEGFRTGMNKHDEEFGVEALAVEWRNMWWVVPSGQTGTDASVDDEALKLRHAMLYYNPEAHTPDHLMAMWIARECLRAKQGARQTHMDTLSR